MPQQIQGELKANSKWRIAIVTSRFNELITNKLLGGAVDCLERFGIEESQIDVAWVPGAFEIPSAAKQIAKRNLHQGILCLGAVIRGSTSHFDYVAGESAKGVAAISLEYDIPVLNSILTTDTIEQAIERAGTKSGNKGFETAMGLIEMISLYENIKSMK